jgi:hypothetical protein
MKKSIFICFLDAILCIPLTAMSSQFELMQDKTMNVKLLETGLSAFALVLTVYVLYVLKQYLKKRLHFMDINNLILLSISIQVIVAIMGWFSTFFPENDVFINFLVLAAMIVTGIMYTIAGVKLLKLPKNPYGILKPFCYLYIVMGLGMASVFLFPIALLASMMGDLLLGVILIKELQKDKEISMMPLCL